MTSNQNNLESTVTQWLEEQGYPLEMQVAEAFHEAKLSVTQSEYFTDPESGKPREIDVVARSDGEWVNYFILDIVFAVECKKASKKPWVVFGTEPREHEPKFLYQSWVSSSTGKMLKRRMADSASVHSLALLQTPRNRGYGITEALTTGKDVPYEAVMSATKYAHAFVMKTNQKEQPALELKQEVVYCSLVFPIVVLDGKLFEAHLDKSGELKVMEVDKSVLLWKYPLSPTDQSQTVVRISTLKDLPNLVIEAQKTVEVLTSCKNEMQKTYEAAIKERKRDFV
jgi:hypothetical protein